jgi:hypothetical protein
VTARRRHRRFQAGWLSWALPLAGAAWVWTDLHDPGRQAGFWTLEGVALASWPLVLTTIFYVVPGSALAVVPRGLRKWWRRGMVNRPPIPGLIRSAVMCADRHRCVHCGSWLDLQIDHVFPWSLGGLGVLFNLMVLCGRCNRVKSNYWRFRSGHEVYRAWEDAGNIAMAREILRSEKWARVSVTRWYRAALSLGVI